MTHDLVRSPAEERLLDAALAQVFTSQRSTVASRPRPWLAAALVLLGVTVTAASMWLARGAARDAAQEPAPLPPQVRAEGKTAIEALPADTENLHAVILQPDHTAVLSRFRKLRRLVLSPLDVHIGPINTGKELAVWNAPLVDLLAEVAQLPALESLQISFQIAVSPAMLEPLRRCASLRELELAGEHVVLDAPLVAALAPIPNLRSLRLDLVRVDAEALSRLASLRLTSLRLSRPPGFDAKAWQQLGKLESLQELSLGDFGRSFRVKGVDVPFWMPEPDELHALWQLPRLRALELQECALHDEHLANLPDTLTSLSLRSTELTPDGWRQLRRFAGLRSLDVTTRRYDLRIFVEDPLRREAADAISESLDTLRLTSLHFHGVLTPALCTAFAAQPDLAELALVGDGIDALDELARAPALRRLRLADPSIPTRYTPELLAPLRASRSLRELELNVAQARDEPGLDEAALQKQLGDGVTLRVYRSLFTIKR